MTGTNQYVTFATGTGANLEALTDYTADPTRLTGEQPGLAKSARFNRAIRQASVAATGVAQFIANNNININDDGDPNAFANNLQSAVAVVAGAVAGASGSFVPLNGSTAMTGALSTPGVVTTSTGVDATGALNGFALRARADGNGRARIQATSANGGTEFGHVDWTATTTTITGNGTLTYAGAASFGGLTSTAGLTVTGGGTNVAGLTATGATSLQAVNATTVAASGAVSAVGVTSSGGLNVTSGTSTVIGLTATGSTSLQGVNAQAVAVTSLTASATSSLQSTTVTSLTSTGAVKAAAAGYGSGIGVLIGAIQALYSGDGTDLGIGAAPGASVFLQNAGNTIAQFDPDLFLRLDAALPRTANDSRAARTDWVRTLGLNISGITVKSASYTLVLADVGSGVFFNPGGTATATLPAASSVPTGLGFLIAADTNTSVTIACAGSDFVVSVGATTPIPPGSGLYLVSNGGSGWLVVSRFSASGIGNKLQTLSGYPFNIGSGTSSYDLTWTAGAYERVLLTISSVTSTGGAMGISALRDGSGNWNSIGGGSALALTSSGSNVGVVVIGANLTAFGSLIGIGSSSGTQAPSLTGGLSGIRLAPSSTTYTFSATGVTLSGA